MILIIYRELKILVSKDLIILNLFDEKPFVVR
jgi:hypothetical protein